MPKEPRIDMETLSNKGSNSIKLPEAWTSDVIPHPDEGKNYQNEKAPPIAEIGPETSDDVACSVEVKVNGKGHVLQAYSNTPLRDVLRQQLGLTSIKDFCNGYGACGSCTVLMNGRPVLSCMVLAVQCEGSVIETVEGIADSKHPLIESYIMNWTAQCGYCTPGFIVTAKALLDRNVNPTVDEIKEALSGNLCRCGTYPVHVKAILEAAKVLRGEE
jgi:carbon-monoxide dehydrogenase small subunit